MEFEVLGPVRILRDGQEAALSGQMQRVLVSMLLLHANRPASIDLLSNALWGGEPDDRALQRLQLHVHRLRQTLGEPERVVFDPGGYRLTVLPGELDAERFESLVTEAIEVATAEPERCTSLIRKALDMWRGTPYQGVDFHELTGEADRLQELRMVAMEELYAAEIACGRHASAVGKLTELARQHPLRERLQALLMTALYKGGRQADALAVYRTAREMLVEELGLEPGPELHALERQILAGEPIGEAVRVPPRTVPAQLPHNVSGFVGRDAELAELDRLLQDNDGARIAVIAGTAGVGKTALAVRWAHEIKDRFPDGQLYVDLRGYGPGQPIPSFDVLAGFLRAFGVEGAAIPQDVDERAARLRSLLDQRRVLIVLDNAATVEHVRPLLPGASSCFVVVTSRDALSGLVVREGAHRVGLDRMTVGEAQGLVDGLMGRARDVDAATTTRLIEHCARLPLALRIAAERIRERPGTRAADLVAELEQAEPRLDLLDAGGDEQTSMRAVFSWSYRQLDDDAALMFRSCGLHPGHDIDLYALTALMGHPSIHAAQQSIATLARAHLVDETTDGRYRLHDLLRVYAAELAVTTEGEEERRSALARLFDYYVYTAWRAMEIFAPQEAEIRPGFAPSVATAPNLDSYESAVRWLETERPNLVTLADRAVEMGLGEYATDISAILWRFLDLGSFLDDSRRLHTTALEEARRRNDRTGEGIALRAVGLVSHRMDRYDEATEYLERALALHTELGNTKLQAGILNDLAGVEHIVGRVDEAVEHLQRSLELFRAAGCRPLEVKPLCNLAFNYRRQGRRAEAFECLEQALTIAEESGNRPGQAHALVNLVKVCRDAGRLQEAIEYAHRVLTLSRDSGIHNVRAYVLDHLGAVYLQLGDVIQAARHHQEALVSARTTGDHDLEARALNGLAEVHVAAGEVAEGERAHREALAVAGDVGIRHEEARARAGLGEICARRGDLEDAAEHWRQAYDIFRSLQAPEAEDLRLKLAESTNKVG
ncbi:AfsR/SARP family transcriptional regulator [Phytoactinopolyspora halotolerans]|uniref:Tetratricopeptide repeat protein n=1 Tax=Phytoactinopolyspora halotolerans TaxID=1981512 RepID=A0A6L9S713_9ACTN|nr:BTAD domain-containing putative transcriptional regulator [Phytoactinopolyspora halotolerans]NEE01255.1 tetratricopeptide repeat protein [Phytoactinopolyspora halotolerans]